MLAKAIDACLKEGTLKKQLMKDEVRSSGAQSQSQSQSLHGEHGVGGTLWPGLANTLDSDLGWEAAAPPVEVL